LTDVCNKLMPKPMPEDRAAKRRQIVRETIAELD
jgi:hypothetical protein